MMKPSEKIKDFIQELGSTLDKASPPDNYPVLLKALWFDIKGEWDKAHEIVQLLQSNEAAHIHAYLHRKQGDLSNARYWYYHAGKAMPDSSTEEEWQELVECYQG